jgi:Ni2+-binding GTPase involved in maturation of urease and hydrogenase
MEMEALKISVAGAAGSGKTYLLNIIAAELERYGYEIADGKDDAYKPTPFEEEIVVTYTK